MPQCCPEMEPKGRHILSVFCLGKKKRKKDKKKEKKKKGISRSRGTVSSNIVMVTVKVEPLNVSFCQCALSEICLALEIK